MGVTRIKKMYEDKKDRRKGDFLVTKPDKKVARKKRTVQKKATLFENRMIKFLKEIGLRDIDGGANFTPGGHQVDACGGYENKLFIIDCTLTDQRRKISLTSKVNEFRGKAKAILKGLRREDPYQKRYKKYADNKNIFFVIATRNILVSEKDKELAGTGDPKITIWEEQFLDHYMDLAKTIGPFAKYHLFGEMELEPVVEDQIEVPTFRMDWGGRGYFYNFMIEPQRLLKHAFVARREIGNEKYYQRILKRSRIKEIKEFIEDGGFFPNNIIIAIKEKCEFKEIKDYKSYDFWPKWLAFGVLRFPGAYRNCWVIDGQHRLFSFTPTSTKKIAVTAFTDLLEHQQAKFFVDINKEQKAVAKDLIWDLEEWMRPSSEEGIISRTVKLLDEKGIFKDKIKIPFKGKKGKKIAFTSFCDSLKYRKLAREYTEKTAEGYKNPYFSKDYNKTSIKLANALNRYFSEIDEIFDEDAKSYFLETGGITVMVTIFERILSTLKRSLSKEDVREYLGLIREVWRRKEKEFYKELTRRSTSEANKDRIARDIIRIFARYNKQFSRFLLEEPSLEAEFVQFERELRDFVNYQLNKVSLDWIRKMVPGEILKRLRQKSKGKEDQELYTFLTLGETTDVINTKNNWEKVFKKILIGEEFSNKQLFDGTLMYLREIRNKLLHGRQPSITEEDKAKEYLRQLRRCIAVE